MHKYWKFVFPAVLVGVPLTLFIMGNFMSATYFHDMSSVKFTEEEREKVAKQIASEKVMVFSKDYCPYCVSTKKLLRELKVDSLSVEEINLTCNAEELLKKSAILLDISNQKTVPNIFVGGKHLGGNSELQALARSGQLKEILDAAGVKHAIP